MRDVPLSHTGRFLYSGFDQQYAAKNGWSSYPDRAAHGGMDYVPWLLQQLSQVASATGQRLLDVFSLHFYPQVGSADLKLPLYPLFTCNHVLQCVFFTSQGGEFDGGTSTATKLLRNRSTRQLWDPNYVSESWIGTQVRYTKDYVICHSCVHSLLVRLSPRSILSPA